MKLIHLHFNRNPHHPEAICKDAMRGDNFTFVDKNDADDIRMTFEAYGGVICPNCRRIAEIYLRRGSIFEKIVAVAWRNHFAAKDQGEARSERFTRLSEIEGRVKLRAASRAYQRRLRQEFCN